MTGGRRRWSFRARITALIAAVLVAGGAVLLGVQYLLVQGLFDTAIGTLTGCVDEKGITVVDGGDVPSSAACQALAAVEASEDMAIEYEGVAVFVRQSTMLSQEVLSGLLLWSVVTLVVFTAAAVLIASWLSRRSFARIGQITATTRRITHDGLHQRLELPGPADEIKELGDTIDTMLDRLEASFTQQERFIANASHELRTPLTTTRTALEIPLTQGQVPAHLAPAIARALDANRRSEELIAALLRLARTAHAIRAEARPADPVDLASLVTAGVSRHGSAIDARGLALTVVASETIVDVADVTLLTLAIDNLVDNAVRHNVDRGTLRVTVGETSERARLEISNSGALLTAEDAARLTEPFNRGPHTRTSAAGRGWGLGLTLVRDIASSLGADLDLSPVEGGGLVARLGLPRSRLSSGPCEPSPTSRS